MPSFFIGSSSNEDSDKISDKFSSKPARPDCFGVTRLEERKKFPIDLQWRKCCPEHSIFTFNQIFFKLDDNQDSHKVSDEFEFWSDLSIQVRVTSL